MSGNDEIARLIAALQPIIGRVRTDVTCIKKDGRQAWTREALTEARLVKHIKGEVARGVCPIKAGESTTQVALLDLDSHKGETDWAGMAAAATTLCDALRVFGLEPIPFRSSGGRGIHLFMLWDAPQDAYSVRQLLTQAIGAVGFKNGAKGVKEGQVEIFPKQDAVAEDGFGNQFILPLTGASVPLLEMAGFLPLEREAAVDMGFPMSYPVPVVERPERSEAMGVLDVDESKLKEALDAIPNQDDNELDYDEWRNIIFAIHSATAGSDTGRALAHEFSARSSKYDEAFLDNRVWPYITDREDGVTARTIFAVARSHGWQEDVTDEFEALPPLDTEDLAKAVRKRKTIPEARHLTTDQANAARIVNTFKSRLIVAADRWYVWCGTHWNPDDSAVYGYAFKLSRIIHSEAEQWEAKVAAALKAGKEEEAKRCAAIAEALVKWAKKSEMRSTIDAALYLAKRMLAVDESQLDRDKWALNCINGTVDLRTGSIKPHDPEDFITRCVMYAYDPSIKSELFENTLAKVTMEDGRATRPIASFLQRWFGYCATGDTREQKFAVHWGSGRNGKSTILEPIAAVLGEYASTAAPGLIVAAAGNAEKHPTEIAALMGRRMVTAHETNENAVLREGFVKWATGSDRMTARFMRENFFEFDPTHKIQLLTNHKPIIRGQDDGIWRRVMLIPFLAKFGSPEEIASGQAFYLADRTLPTQLEGERQGILTWIVQGAVDWHQQGLNPPDSVLAAGKDYQSEQDRMLQFIKECCELGPDCKAPLGGDFGGLFPAYTRWCTDSGFRGMGKTRFLQELERVVPGYDKRDEKAAGAGGKRRTVVTIFGIGLLEE